MVVGGEYSPPPALPVVVVVGGPSCQLGLPFLTLSLVLLFCVCCEETPPDCEGGRGGRSGASEGAEPGGSFLRGIFLGSENMQEVLSQQAHSENCGFTE